eukprot:jgi/Chlat1/5915/Chrsp4S06248
MEPFSAYRSLNKRAEGSLSNTSFKRDAASAGHFIRRLARTHTLDGHSGCVNCLSWASLDTAGQGVNTLLLSSGDDCRVRLWDTNSGECIRKYHSGHCGNVFCVKQVAAEPDKILTCAADGQVRLSSVSRGTSCELGRHAGIAHKLDMVGANEVYSCGGDGTIQHWDLREKGQFGMQAVVAHVKNDYNGFLHGGLHSIAVEPINQWHVAAGGATDNLVRVWDRRMWGGSDVASSSSPCSLVATFCPPPSGSGSSVSFPYSRVTSVAYSHDGAGLLASYAGGDVWVFPTEDRVSASTDSKDDADDGGESERCAGVDERRRVEGAQSGEAIRECRGWRGAFERWRRRRREGSDTGQSAASTDATPNAPNAATHDSHADDTNTESSTPSPPPYPGTEGDRQSDSDPPPPKLPLSTWRRHWRRVRECESGGTPGTGGEGERISARADIALLLSALSFPPLPPLPPLPPPPPPPPYLLSSSHSDLYTLSASSSSSTRSSSRQSSVPMSYRGHRNVRTVKDAGFLGSRSQWVWSGSDDGFLYIWDRHTGSLAAKLRSDSQVVNCAAFDPSTCTLATGGLEHTVKVWEPVRDAEITPAELASVEDGGSVGYTHDTVRVPASVLRALLLAHRRGEGLRYL